MADTPGSGPGNLISAGISLYGAIVSMNAADEFAAQASAAHAEAMGYAKEEVEGLSRIASKEENRTDPFRQKTRDFILGSGIDPRMASEIKRQESANIRAISTQGALGAIGAGDIARQATFTAGNQMTQGAFQTNAQRLQLAAKEGDISNVLRLQSAAADRSKLTGLSQDQSKMLYGQAGAASAAAAEGFGNAAESIGKYVPGT